MKKIISKSFRSFGLGRLFGFSILACAVALVIATPLNSQAVVLDDFNSNEGHFASAPNASGTTVGLDGALSKIDRITTNAPLEGDGHQRLFLVHTNGAGAATPLRLRHLSGGGTVANNTVIPTTAGTDGFIGFYLKTTATGFEASLNLDGAAGGIADMDASTSTPVISDGAWHLYEWDLDSTTAWGAVPGIGGGHGGALVNGNHTIDSIYIRDLDGSPGPDAEIYLDFVAYNTNGSVANLLLDPCLATSGVLVGGPLSTNSNQVQVTGVDAAATAVKVYQNSGAGLVLIGTKNASITAGDNAVTVSGLVKNALVIATQTKNGQESCVVPTGGIYVGGGANPSVRMAYSIRETTDTGPVGVSATTTSSGNIHFLGAANLSGGAPVDGRIISPSNGWQTVTFSRGDFETVADAVNAAGSPTNGTGYPADYAASIQVYAYRLLTNNVRVYSATPTETSFISSNNTFNIYWTWDAVPGAQGYRLLRNVNAAGYLDHHDVAGTNVYTDNNAGWTTGVAVAPSVARSQPSVKWNTGSGDPIGTQNSIQGDWGILESIDFAINSDTGPFDLYIDNIQNGSTVFQTFETVAAGTTDYGFRQPNFSGTTGPGLLAVPNLGVVTNITADTGTNSFRIQWQWNGTNASRWLRLTTSGGTDGTANPLVNLDDPISIRLLLLPVGASIPGGIPTISYTLNGNQLVLNWTGTFNLESKTNLNEVGWTSEGVNTGPSTNTITGSAKFYRLHNP